MSSTDPTTLSQLPQVFNLSGNELFLLSQPQSNPQPVPWVSYAITTQDLKNFILYNTGQSVSMRQLKLACQAQGVLLTLFAALPADVTSQYNIAWNNAVQVNALDPFITGFLQPTLGYSGAQVTALLLLASGYPA
jgi:hypothetical protein